MGGTDMVRYYKLHPQSWIRQAHHDSYLFDILTHRSTKAMML
jgi:hypothetical protein